MKHQRPQRYNHVTLNLLPDQQRDLKLHGLDQYQFQVLGSLIQLMHGRPCQIPTSAYHFQLLLDLCADKEQDLP